MCCQFKLANILCELLTLALQQLKTNAWAGFGLASTLSLMFYKRNEC